MQVDSTAITQVRWTAEPVPKNVISGEGFLLVEVSVVLEILLHFLSFIERRRTFATF